MPGGLLPLTPLVCRASGCYTRSVAKLFVAFGLVAYLASASIDGSTCDEGGCTQSCSSDDSQGHCPPDCTDCDGCIHLNLLVAIPGLSLPSVLAPRTIDVPRLAPPSPEPREILHVPKPRLA